MLFKASRLLGFSSALATWNGHAIAKSADNISSSSAISMSDMQDAILQPRTNIGNGVELRIYPLGDSITNGYLSSDDNGYRIGLQRNLAGSNLNFVGSKTSGTMQDGWNDGWNGFMIQQIGTKAQASERSLDPNIILVHVGTNDLNQPMDPDHAPDRLSALLDLLISEGSDPVILVAQIINCANQATEDRIQKFNEAVPGIVDQRAKAGHKVMVVDMRSITSADLKDGLHPTDAGYQKMADLWVKGIEQADAKGWIKAPKTARPNLENQGQSSGQHCLKPPFWAAAFPDDNKPIATGVGHNGDMKFKDNWDPKLNAAPSIGKVGTGVVFADLNGDGRADYLFVNKTTGSVILYLNTGTGDTLTWDKFNDGKEIASGLAPRELVRFVDIDHDGKDDYCVMGEETGSVTVWLNKGPDPTAPGGWSWNGPHEVAPGAPGAKGANVSFADINGDGRLDYLVKNSNGDIDAYLNIGQDNTIEGIQWIGAGHIAAGFGTDEISIADINGDGRADYILWGDKGALTGYLNYRTEKEGQPGWASTGAMGSVAAGLGKPSSYCRLADINGDGKADYIILRDDGSGDIYLNNGEADASVVGDGVRLASLSGKHNGLDDYVWLGPNAAVTLYVNGGYSADGKDWVWYPINKGDEIANGAGAKRDQIIFADIDGDGKEDFCIVDPKTGALTLYKNGGQQPDGSWGWVPTGLIFNGIGGPGKAVRLADMDGDGKADYMLLKPNGATVLYLNNGEKPGGWKWVVYNDEVPIASGIGFTRDHVQFKDIDGDGKADYIGVNQLDGSTIVYVNKGPNPNSPGLWAWVPMNDAKPIASGVGAVGADVRLGRIEKTNRYSYFALAPNTGALRAWKNGCDELSQVPHAPGNSGGSSGSGSGSGNDSGNNGSGSDSGNNGSGNGSGNNGSGNDSGNNGSGNNGSGNNGSGNSGSGNSGSGGNNGSGVYLDGGLAIPDNGLGGLGLPIDGIPALTGVQPYAITAQNDLTTAIQAVNGLISGHPTPGAVSAAADAVNTAIQDLGSLATSTKGWNSGSFDPSSATAVQQNQAALQAAAGSLTSILPALRACSNSPATCGSTFSDAAKALGDGSTSLNFFGSNASSGNSDNSGSASGSGGPGEHQTLGGGLQFPEGGLGGLGLPTRETPSIDALKPYAITTQNALGKAIDLLKGLLSGLGGVGGGGGGGISLLGLPGAIDALGVASSDFSALSTQFNAIELDSFSGGGLTWVRNEQSALQTAAKTVSGWLSQLRTCATNLNCGPKLTAAISILSAAQIYTSLQDLIMYNGLIKASQTSKTPSSPTATPSSTKTPSEWLLNTIPGTSVDAFQKFIKTLPDGGAGEQIVYDAINTQGYVAKMTLEEAKVVNRLPIVDKVVSNEPMKSNKLLVPTNETTKQLQRRFTAPRIAVEDPSPRWDYSYEATNGEGAFVYVFDFGFDLTHPEFTGLSVETAIFAGTTLPASDGDSHGTAVAALVAGRSRGVSKRSNLVLVKVSDNESEKWSVLYRAWMWANQDVAAKGRSGKAVFLFAITFFHPYELDDNGHVEAYHQPPYNLPRPGGADIWVPMMAQCIQQGVPVVLAAGNTNLIVAEATTQGWLNPQRFATAQNFIINVGFVDGDGNKSPLNLPTGRGGDGSPLEGTFSVYAMAKDIIIADLNPTDPYRTRSGTSFAAPQIAALAAYYLTLPNTVLPETHLIPMAVKNHITGLARDDSFDGEGVAYNGVREALCAPITNPKRNRRAAEVAPFNETDAVDPEAAWKEWISMGMDPDEFSDGE
ncbi:MAG: hypothetical protein LQ350_004960 [Teloschistes chrysophthalmus]|nr:MAG: hypothetical protein LQ350_004960 [Niorma chrysophthalma]